MASSFRPTTPDDAGPLTTFLGKYLEADASRPGFTADDVRWKYWVTSAEGEGSRSFVLERDHRFEAHCALLPVHLVSDRGALHMAHFSDWAADPLSLGAGVRLLKKAAARVDALCAVGGSADTRKILPLMGFRPAGERATFVRPLRPLRHALTHQFKNWKLPVRLLRNAHWSWSHPAKPPRGWSAREVKPDEIDERGWQVRSGQGVLRDRRAEVYTRYLKCPFMRFALYLAENEGIPAGCFLLGFAPGEARVADLWLFEGSESYEEMYRLAVWAAKADPTTAEITTCASTPTRRDALMRCGFRRWGSEPIMVYPGRMATQCEYDCQLLDNDEAFLITAAPAYHA